jgi:acyl carrier protein
MKHDIAQIEQKVIEYVAKNTHIDAQKIAPKTMLFKEGIFDSMAFVLLIDFIEQTFGVKPGDEDLVEENFESIEAISRYIQKKTEVTVT